jgi:MYXO-CTERM domain-containing protein
VAAAPAAIADPMPLPEPGAEPPAPMAELPPVLAPEALPANPPTPAEPAQPKDGVAPELIAGIAALGALGLLAFLVGRRRRRRIPDETHNIYEEPTHVAEPEPVMAAPLDPVAREPAVAAAVLPAAEAGRPWIDFEIRPVRAGVGKDQAVVEFEMTVGNTGSVTARDVRVSTWLLAAGSGSGSEMERMLIDRPLDNAQPGVTIDPGNGRKIETAVAMPTAGLAASILPLVVADVRYRLPDGSEGRTSASFEVGVLLDGELAHFDVEHPSGLHEGVQARLHGQPQRV